MATTTNGDRLAKLLAAGNSSQDSAETLYGLTPYSECRTEKDVMRRALAYCDAVNPPGSPERILGDWLGDLMCKASERLLRLPIETERSHSE